MFQNTSSFVFVGEFNKNPIDENSLFDGKIDSKGRVITEQVVQCNYMNGLYQLQSFPDRIDLKSNTTNVMPIELVTAYESILEQLESAKRAITITAFGMNCATLVQQNSISTDGLEYCFRLSNKQILEDLIDEKLVRSLARVHFNKDDVQYEVRIEPHFQTQGSNIYLAVNAHQNITDQELLKVTIEKINSFRGYVEGLYHRIIKSE